MATSPVNNIVRGSNAKSVFASAKAVLTSAVSFNQGDMIALDTTNHRLKAVTATTDAANFLGIAPLTVVSGIVKSPYTTAVDASMAIESMSGPLYSVDASLILKTGDAFNPGDLVYISAVDAQTVTVTAPASPNDLAIGVFADAAVSSAAAGQKALIHVGARYGMSALSL